MKKSIILLISILAITISCAKKEIKLPNIYAKGVQELHNHSAIWVFYKTKGKTTIANINKNNTITSTNWIYNIDKRLPLKTFIEPLKKLKHKHANSIHSEEGMLDYFSYSDTSEKKLSFISFSEVIFKLNEQSKDYLKKHTEIYDKYLNIHLTFNKENIEINNQEVSAFNLETEIKKLINSTTEKDVAIHLNFSKNILYQDYLNYFVLIHQFKETNININKHQFIF